MATDRGPDTEHWLVLGPDPELAGDRPPPRRHRWYALVAALVVAAAVLLTRNQHTTAPLAARPSDSQAGPVASGSVRPLPGIHPPPPGLRTADRTDAGLATVPTTFEPTLGDARSVTVTDLGHPLLDVPADWELFGQGQGVVVRIELRHGRLTRTAVPEVGSAGPVYFVVGGDRAIVHPMDQVPGYVVHDKKPAVRLPSQLDQAYSVFPGPDARHLWAETRAGTASALSLLTLDGRPAGVQVPIPADATVQASDRAGNVLMLGVGGRYDARPDGLHRITSGTLLAAGPTRWLALECDERYRCAGVVIDRGTGQRRSLVTPLNAYQQDSGAISPDGRVAALLQPDGRGGGNLELVDLATGLARLTGVTTGSDRIRGGRILAWSPDSRWLFVTDGNGRLLALDRTGRVTGLEVSVGAIDQIALRTAAR